MSGEMFREAIPVVYALLEGRAVVFPKNVQSEEMISYAMRMMRVLSGVDEEVSHFKRVDTTVEFLVTQGPLFPVFVCKHTGVSSAEVFRSMIPADSEASGGVPVDSLHNDDWKAVAPNGLLTALTACDVSPLGFDRTQPSFCRGMFISVCADREAETMLPLATVPRDVVGVAQRSGKRSRVDDDTSVVPEITNE